MTVSFGDVKVIVVSFAGEDIDVGVSLGAREEGYSGCGAVVRL